MSQDGVSRRSLLRAGAAAGVAAVTIGTADEPQARTIHGEMPWAPGEADAPVPVESGPYAFFTPEEAGFIDAALDRLIPEDSHGPGARTAGGTLFLDRQLAGSYGQAQRWYMQGPWQKGEPTQGYQLRLTPAQLYRAGIKAVDDHCRAELGGKRFAELPPDKQDEILSGIEGGKLALPGVDAKTFFEQLLQNSIESFFADPLYGGNKEMVAWKMIGFPGARYDHRDWVARHGERYPLPPVALRGRAAWRAKKA
jgi:gluconate 2-dehydrogenase gamma chain